MERGREEDGEGDGEREGEIGRVEARAYYNQSQ